MKIGPLVLGTWTFAGDRIWGPSEAALCHSVVHRAIERGVDLFDTAPNYGDGRSEEVLGEALLGHPDARVATKIKVQGLSPADIRTAVEESLRRLRRDRIDLMQIHWPAETPGETGAALDSFLTLKEEGLVAEIGVCNFGVADAADFGAYPIVSNQIPYSLLWRVVEGEHGIAAASRRAGWHTIAYSVLQQGLLSGAYRSLGEFPEGRHRTRHFSKALSGYTEMALVQLQRLAWESGVPLLRISLRATLAETGISSILLGARTPAQLDGALDAIEVAVPAAVIGEARRVTEDLKHATGGNPDMYQARVRY